MENYDKNEITEVLEEASEITDTDTSDEKENIMFEALVPYNAKNYKAVYNKICGKICPKWCLISIVVCSAIIIAEGCFCLPIAALFTLSVVIAALLLLCSFYIISRKGNLKNTTILNNDEQCDEIFQLTDKIQIKDKNGQHTFDVCEVTEFIERKNLFILAFNKTVWILIPKDAFIIGNAGDFAEYIKVNMKTEKLKSKLKIFPIVASVLIIVLTIAYTLSCLVMFAAIFSRAAYDSSYTKMRSEQLSSLSDSELMSAVEARIDNKEYEETFLTIDNFSQDYNSG